MRKNILLLCIFTHLFGSKLMAQKDSVEKIYAFKITDYINKLSDSTSVVQIMKPTSLPINIREKQVATLYHCFKSGITLDTAMIGWGKCQLIKGEYYYFSLHQGKMQQPTGGDLLYMKLKLPAVYDGLLLNTMNRAILFNNVYGEPFMNSEAIFTNSKKNESDILDSMVNDIQFTGKAMLTQMPEQNQTISSGIFKGKKLFAAMQAATRSDLESFLKYVAARPRNYAANDWKISEVFATWITTGSPTVLVD